MKCKAFIAFLTLLFSPALFATSRPDGPALATEPEQFQVTQKTEVPNVTLQPGTYSIRVVDHLRDRVILQVSSNANHVKTTFIAVPAATMANAPVGPIPYSTGPKGKAALKGFAFPGGLAVEFVYPKNDAVSIAQANDTRVMAIDPASEGRVPAPNLNPTDMQMITLWMLEPSRVGPGDSKQAAIAASKYVAPQTAASAPVETAQTQPAPASTSPAPSSPSYASSAPQSASGNHAPRRQRPVQLAENNTPPPPPARSHTRPANVTALPHTASNLPLLWAGALVSLFAGAVLSFRRLTANV
jgi:hypothetical protein